jgi:prepilin-type N-terminal cleavage/methylation domain-containing protein
MSHHTPLVASHPSHHGRAFTLIELLVVISIIGVLAAMLMPAIGMIRNSARSQACLSSMRQMGLATMAYIDANEGLLPPCQIQVNPADANTWKYWTDYLAGDAGSDLFRKNTAGKFIPVAACPRAKDLGQVQNNARNGYGFFFESHDIWNSRFADTYNNSLTKPIPLSKIRKNKSGRALIADSDDYPLALSQAGADNRNDLRWMIKNLPGDVAYTNRHGGGDGNQKSDNNTVPVTANMMSYGKMNMVFMDGRAAAMKADVAWLAVFDPKRTP